MTSFDLLGATTLQQQWTQTTDVFEMPKSRDGEQEFSLSDINKFIKTTNLQLEIVSFFRVRSNGLIVYSLQGSFTRLPTRKRVEHVIVWSV